MKEYLNDKKRIIERYNSRILKLGQTIEGLGSGSKERQFLRFKLLLDVGELEGKKILDLGCGFGDLLDFLSKEGITVEYEGWDINEEIIKNAKAKHPGHLFYCKDILNDEDWNSKEFDFVLSSSSFNNKLIDLDNYKLIEAILKRCYAIAKDGVGINFQTDYVDFRREDVFYYSPEEVFRICKKITKKVTLKHDFPLFDFAIFLYKDFAPWGKNG